MTPLTPSEEEIEEVVSDNHKYDQELIRRVLEVLGYNSEMVMEFFEYMKNNFGPFWSQKYFINKTFTYNLNELQQHINSYYLRSRPTVRIL